MPRASQKLHLLALTATSCQTAPHPAHFEALLWASHGKDIDWCSGDGPRHLDNLLWLAAELARKAGELFQLSEMARRGALETGG